MSQSELIVPRLEDEPALLGPWVEAFARVFGEAPRIEPFDEAHPLERRITVPLHPFEPPELVGGTGHFRHLPAIVDHMRRLGFDWPEGGRVLTMPTPATFLARLARHGLPGSGYRLVYAIEDRPTLTLGPWMRRVCEGTWTVHLCREPFYREATVGLRARELRFQLGSLVHDVSTHALNYQLVPHRAVRTIAGRIAEALPQRWSAWPADDAPVPLQLSYFFDNDLNRYCYAVWCRTPTLDAFAPRFERHFDQLLRALELRLDELARHGDVASGDTRDMPPPTPVNFDVN